MSISIRNRLLGAIEKIVSDKVVSEVVIRTAAGNVTSIITTGSVQRMNLKEGEPFLRSLRRPTCPSKRNSRRFGDNSAPPGKRRRLRLSNRQTCKHHQ